MAANLDVENAARLRSVILAMPGSKTSELIEAFRAATGRKISQHTISRYRALVNAPRVRPAHHLTTEQAATLDRMIREADPGESFGRITRRFEEETGRPVGVTAISPRARALGITRRSSWAGKRSSHSAHQLTIEQGVILDRMIREADPGLSFGRIADDFKAATGREIGVCSVGKRAKRLGIVKRKGQSRAYLIASGRARELRS